MSTLVRAVEDRRSRSGRRCLQLARRADFTSSSRELRDELREVLVAVEDLLRRARAIACDAELLVEHVLELRAEHARTPAEVRLEDLPDVHAARHAERVEHEVDRRAVLRGTACPLPAGCGEMTPLLP